MTKNMGSFDKILRIIIALVFIVLAITGQISGTWETVLIIVAAILLLTSMIGFCPLYLPFKISTCSKKKE